MNNWYQSLSGVSTDQLPSYSSLLEAYQSEKTMNSMYASQLIPSMAKPALPNSAMFLAALQHEAARKAQLQTLFAYQGGLQASGNTLQRPSFAVPGIVYSMQGIVVAVLIQS